MRQQQNEKKIEARRIPFNLDAEMGVLGSVLIDDTVFDKIGHLIAADFYRDSHKLIFEAMTNLKNRGIPADFINLSDELIRHDKMEAAGGLGYLSELSVYVPTSGNAVHYASIVERTAILRRLIHAAGEIAALAYEEEDDALDRAEQILYAIRKTGSKTKGFTAMPTLMNSYLEELEYLDKHKGTITGVTTGFRELDVLTQGLQRSDLIILAARPAVGKTSLALTMGYNAARAGKNVAIYSLEMGAEQLARRLVSMDSKINMQDLRSGWIDWEEVLASTGRLSDLPIWVNDTAGNPITSIRSQLRGLMQDVKIDLVIVDYLQLVEAGDDTKKTSYSNNRVQEISIISRGLKQIAREMKVPVLALAQLSRKVEDRQVKIPQLSDLKESSSIEENADAVFFLYRQDYYDEQEQKPEHERERKGEADLIIAKQRNGPLGTVVLRYQADQTMFYPLMKEVEDDEY